MAVTHKQVIINIRLSHNRAEKAIARLLQDGTLEEAEVVVKTGRNHKNVAHNQINVFRGGDGYGD